MAVLPSWPSFRLVFGIGGNLGNQLLGSTVGSFSFIPGPPGRISQLVGNFVTDHHVAGQYSDVIGTALNDGRYLLTGVQALLLTFANVTFQLEGPVAATVGSTYRDLDQNVSFPSELHPTTDLVRSGGFTAGFTGIDKPYTGATMTISCNGGAADSAYSVAEYHWYLSQRTDDPAKQFLSIQQLPDAGLTSYSGTIEIVHTALATSELGISGTPTMNQVKELFKMNHLYCKRVSDGAIQWVDLYREMLIP